jgi:hypothetical protein
MSPINHLTKDDPPALLDYGVEDVDVDLTTDIGTVVHHPRLGIALQKKMHELGLECVVQYPNSPDQKPRVSQFDFISRHFGKK